MAMTLTLTEWWAALEADLDRLALRVGNSQSMPWVAVRTMVSEGLQIESSLFGALKHRTNIEAAARQFCERSEEGGYSLPSIHNPEQLLFAITYYEHLNRYANINKGHFLVLQGVERERVCVAQAAQKLKTHIDTFCDNQANAFLLAKAFPEAANQPVTQWYDKITSWLSTPSLEKNLLEQLHIQLTAILTQHAQDITLEPVFNQLTETLSHEEQILRRIAGFMLLIELLHQSSDKLLAYPDNSLEFLKTNFPQCVSEWGVLRQSVSLPGAMAVNAFNTTKKIAGFIGRSWEVANTFSQKHGLNHLIPQVVRTPFIKGAVLLKGAMPLGPQESQKQALLVKAQEQIAKLSLTLCQGKLSFSDFKDKSASDIRILADKIVFLKRFVCLQQRLAIVQHTHNTGVVRIAQLPVFATLTEWLSQTFLRPLVHQEFFVLQEAMRLKQIISSLQGRVKSIKDDTELKVIEKDFSKALTTTQKTLEDLNQYRFLFFNSNTQVNNKLRTLVEEEISTLGKAAIAA